MYMHDAMQQEISLGITHSFVEKSLDQLGLGAGAGLDIIPQSEGEGLAPECVHLVVLLHHYAIIRPWA